MIAGSKLGLHNCIFDIQLIKQLFFRVTVVSWFMPKRFVADAPGVCATGVDAISSWMRAVAASWSRRHVECAILRGK